MRVIRKYFRLVLHVVGFIYVIEKSQILRTEMNLYDPARYYLDALNGTLFYFFYFS